MVDDIVAGVISAGVLYVIGHHWPIGLFDRFSPAAPRCRETHIRHPTTRCG